MPERTKRGNIRVTNMRVSMSPDSQPDDEEIVISIDRSNIILGNKHILYNKFDLIQRERVIAAYGRDLERDFAVCGPMFKAVNEIADLVKSGERVCLACWCKPSPCHGDLLVKKVLSLLDLNSEKNE